MVARHAVIHEIAVAFAKYPPIKCLDLDDASGQVKLEGLLYIVFLFSCPCVAAESRFQFCETTSLA